MELPARMARDRLVLRAIRPEEWFRPTMKGYHMPAQVSKASRPIQSMPPAFIQLLDRMALEATQEDPEFGSPTVSSMLKILESATEDEMWEADELGQTGGRDLRDIEMEIRSYAVKWSAGGGDISSAFRDRESGRQMYILVKSVRLDNGEEFIWNTSAPLLVGKIFWLADRGMLPAQCVIRGTDLGAGAWLLKLKPIPKRAVQGEPPF